jgi:hypothetical protein
MLNFKGMRFPIDVIRFCRVVDQRRKLAENVAARLTLDGPLLPSQKTCRLTTWPQRR